MLYNSALRNGTVQESAWPTERFEHYGSIGKRWNIVTEPPPNELYQCDVIYCEPPFPAGLKVFDRRAGESTKDYTVFAEAFAEVWRTISVPKYAIVNHRLLTKLPAPSGIVVVKLNNAKERLAYWDAPKPEEDQTNLSICKWLGKSFTRLGDITCGYGMPVLHFVRSRPGNTFFASDYDPHCITVLSRLTKEAIPND